MGCGSSAAFAEAIAAGLFPDASSFTSSSLFSRHFFDHSHRWAAPGANAAGAGGGVVGGAGGGVGGGGDAKYADVNVDHMELPDDDTLRPGGRTGAGALGGGTTLPGADTADVIRPRFACGVVRNALRFCGPTVREYYLSVGIQTSLDGKSGFRAPLRLCFVLDISGSMAKEYSPLNPEVTKLDLAKATLLHLVESVALPPGGYAASSSGAGAAIIPGASAGAAAGAAAAAAGGIPAAAMGAGVGKFALRRLLTERDYVSVICINEDVRVLLPMTNCAQIDLKRFRAELTAVRAIGGLNLKAGVEAGLRALDAHDSATPTGVVAPAGAGAMPSPSAPPGADDSRDAKSAAGGSGDADPSAVRLEGPGGAGAGAGAGAGGSTPKLSNRIFVVSDCNPSLGEPKASAVYNAGGAAPAPQTEGKPPELGYLGLLAQAAARRSQNIIYTTVFAVGLDAPQSVAGAVQQMRGGNHYVLSGDLENNRFVEQLNAEFEYLVSPVCINLRMELQAAPFDIDVIHGWEPAPDAPAPPAGFGGARGGRENWDEDWSAYDAANHSGWLSSTKSSRSSSNYYYREQPTSASGAGDGEFLKIKTLFPAVVSDAGSGDAKAAHTKGGLMLLKLRPKFTGHDQSEEQKANRKRLFARPNLRLALRFENIHGEVRRKFYRIGFPANSLALTDDEAKSDTFVPVFESHGVRKAVLLSRYWTLVHRLLQCRYVYEHNIDELNALRAFFEAEMKVLGADDALKYEHALLEQLPKVAPKPERSCCTIL